MNSQSDAKYPIGIFLKLLVQRHHHYRSQNFKAFQTARPMIALDHVRDLGPVWSRENGTQAREEEEESMIQLSNVVQRVY